MGQPTYTHATPLLSQPASARARSTTEARPGSPIEVVEPIEAALERKRMPVGSKEMFVGEDDWWNGQEVVYEAFLDAPTSPTLVHPSATELPVLEPSEDAQATAETGATLLINEPVSAGGDPVDVPTRYTITEEELAAVLFDSAELDHFPNPDADSDFELAWDSDDNSSEMDIDRDDETPPPWTPEISQSLLPIVEVAPVKTLPVPIPVRLPLSSSSSLGFVPGTTTPNGTPKKNITRLRGFTLRSPRTEPVF